MDKTGLPMGFLVGEVSVPRSETGLLLGELVAGSPVVEDTGERMGECEWWSMLPMDDRLVRPARWIDSREPPMPAWPWCSACTTSAKLMKLSRRTSVLSRLP